MTFNTQCEQLWNQLLLTKGENKDKQRQKEAGGAGGLDSGSVDYTAREESLWVSRHYTGAQNSSGTLAGSQKGCVLLVKSRGPQASEFTLNMIKRKPPATAHWLHTAHKQQPFHQGYLL